MRILVVLIVAALAGADMASAQTEAWRTAAEERIEQHRKGTLQITVRDDEGNPVPNATVHAEMTRHAFGWGTAINANVQSSNDTYRAKLDPNSGGLTGDGRTFNLAVFENAMKWRYWQNTAVSVKNQRVNQVLWLLTRGMDVRGHTLIWGDTSVWPNAFRDSDDVDYLRTHIEDHIKATAGYPGLKGVLREWDVVNEPVNQTPLRDKFAGKEGYPTGEEIYAEAFQWAAEADPEARLFVNEYNTLNGAGASWANNVRQQYIGVVNRLLDADAPVHGIGLQGHINPSTRPTPENTYAALEAYAATGLKLAVTEYDFVSPSGCTTPSDEQLAANFLRDFLTVVYSHPSVESFTMWGYWDEIHWRCDSPLFRSDWSLKPSGEVFLDLVFDEWWTDETVTTDAEGVAYVRATLGEYALTAEIPDGTITRGVSVSENDTTRVTMSRTGVSAEGEQLPLAISLHQNHPNPFQYATTISFELPQSRHVALKVYNAMGQEVETLLDAEMPSGVNEAFFDASTLPSGLYFYQVRTGGSTETRRMMLVR